MNEIIVKEIRTNEIERLKEDFIKYLDVEELTIKAYITGISAFQQYLKTNFIQFPTREDIIAFRDSLRETHKPNTINTYLIALRSFFSWLEYIGIAKDITKNIKGIKLERIHLKRGLSQEEIEKVLRVCKDLREILLVKLAITCALRINEIANIELQDFYNDNGVVMLKVLGKARAGLKQDNVKVDSRIFELIKEYCHDYNPTDYLFFSTSNNNKGGKMTTKCLREIITNLFKRAGLDMERLSPHSFRHSACEILLEENMPIQEVSEFMRHKNLTTTLIYSKELNKRNCQASAMLGNYLF